MSRIVWIAMFGALAVACSNGDSGQNADTAADRPAAEPEAREETVFDPLVGTMDRAKGVETLSGGRMDELNKQLEESE